MSFEKLYAPDCMYTFSGKLVNITDLKQADIAPEDIAIGLARECRFGNHTKKIWSVADHSLKCVEVGQALYPGDNALHFRLLMHDAHEAYMGDLCTPNVDSIDKLYPGFKDTVEVVKRLVQRSINDRFGISIDPLLCEKVKEVDRQVLEWEWEHKVMSWKGFQPMPDIVSADIWLSVFKKLVKVPVVIGSISIQ